MKSDLAVHGVGRREFLVRASSLGVASVLGSAGEVAAEPPVETTRIKLSATPAICLAPQYVAGPLLRAEGFTNIEYVKHDARAAMQVGSGEADISMAPLWTFMVRADLGDPVVMLAGVHLGCYELVGGDRVRSIRELKGKTIPILQRGEPAHLLLSSIAAYVGLDPARDVNWLECSPAEQIPLFAADKVDALMAFPPQPQELRTKKLGRVIVDTARDTPWSHYYCCVVVANTGFAHKYPVATKRALRAILKAADLCAQEPEQAASIVVDKGFTPHYDYAVQALKDVPYDSWRTYDPEDSLRFYALRLHDVGMIKSSPQKIIERATDWRFLNELRNELKV